MQLKHILVFFCPSQKRTKQRFTSPTGPTSNTRSHKRDERSGRSALTETLRRPTG